MLTRLLPTARIERLDSTVTGGSRLTKTLSAFRRRDIDILVGTQIIAKGHDFPGVTLVGALCADMGLSFPDFRASERTFQLLTQVAGRAGRGTQPGRVFIQTWLPEHTALAMAQRQDFTGFAKGELEQRRMRRYPPYTALALLRFSAPELARAEEAASRARVFVEARAGKYPSGQVELLGPSRAPISYLRNRFRMQLLVRADSRATIQAIFRNTGGLLYERIGRSGGLRWSLDIDPVNLM